jgi:hypothetical protein
MANMEKLNATLRYIRTHMNLWDQTTWFKPIGDEFTSRQIVDMILEDPYDPACGVTGCMAGLACFQNGYVPIFKVSGVDDWADVNPGELVAKRDPETGQLGSPSTTKTAAADIFEISMADATRLFDSENTYEDLQAMVAHLGERDTLVSFESRERVCSCGDPDCHVDGPWDEDEDDYDHEDIAF